MCAVRTFFFNERSTSGPLSLGNNMSRTIKSGRRLAAIRHTSSPSPRLITVNPALVRTRSVATRKNLLSSTSKMVAILGLYPRVPGQGERFVSRGCVWVPICVFHSVATILLGPVQRDVCLIQKTLGLQFAKSARDRYSHAYRHTAFLRGGAHRRVAY